MTLLMGTRVGRYVGHHVGRHFSGARFACLVAATLLAVSALQAQGGGQTPPNTLTPADRAAGWRLLFDGKTTTGWTGYKASAVPSGWHIVDGALTKDAPVADIVSMEEFDNFELQMDWKIGEGGNSGIFYRGTNEYEHIYWSAPEYQLLDDVKGSDNKTRLTCAGAAYALYPSPAGHLKPVGEWNTARIVASGSHVEHWLNGVKLVEYEAGSPDWEAKVKASKFGVWPNFGRARKGHIAMQGDHAGTLAFRNIRIRSLPARGAD